MFGITARDVYSNLMTNEVYWSIAIVNLANTSITVPATTDFQSPGSYVISYSVEIAGDYSVYGSRDIQSAAFFIGLRSRCRRMTDDDLLQHCAVPR